jgi:hypothetical protein
VATVHDVVKESGWVIPHPSAVFHMYASADTPWVARTLSHCTLVKQGKVSSNSVTHDATQFAGPHESRMHQYTTQTCSPGPDDRSLIETGGATELEIQIYDPDHSHHSHPVFFLSPNCPARSPIMPSFSFILVNPHKTSIDRNGPIVSGFQPLVFYG